MVENCNWIEVNDALCDLLGYEREDFLQKNWLELAFSEDLEAYIRRLSQILAGRAKAMF